MLATLILAGCGGSGQSKAQWQTVHGPGYRFAAPVSWRVTTAPGRTEAKQGDEFVQVATFPLAHAYSDSLFAKVQPELARRMATVAARAGGSVTGHSVDTVAGRRSHVYDVRVGDVTTRYTFVLRGKREYLLVCSAASTDCDELAASFAVA